MRLHLIIHSLPRPFYSRALYSQNLSVSHHYRFVVEGYYPDFITPQALLGQTAQLTLSDIQYPGVVSGVQLRARLQRGWAYRITFASPWHPFTQQQHHRTWSQVSLDTLIQELSKECPFNIQWCYRLKQTMPEFHNVVQYGESDYSLIQRLLYQSRCVWWLGSDVRQLIITISDYWPKRPTRTRSTVLSTGLLANKGCVYQLSQHWNEQQQTYLRAFSHEDHLALGDSIQLHNQYYRVAAIRYRVQQGDMMTNCTGTHCCLEVLLWPEQLGLLLSPRKQAPCWFVFTGTVCTAAWDPQQQQGVYCVRYHFDERQQVSKPLARCELGSDMTTQFNAAHWPLQEGNDVLLGCIAGDWSQAVILGVLSTSKMPTPVTADNPEQHVWRHRGYEWLWQEGINTSYQRLSHGSQSLLMQSKPPKLSLSSDHQGIKMDVAECLNHQADEITAQSEDKMITQIEGDGAIEVREGNLEYRSQHDISLVAKTLMAQAEQRMQFEAQQLQITSTQGVSVTTHTLDSNTTQNTQLKSHAGIQLQSSSGDLKIQGGESTVVINQHGIHFSSGSIELQAKKILINGHTKLNPR